ncbi:MAG: DUF2085 domain-containing protein [Euryarchaeota archaeon]|nr:DUF2085 domain-containing protein [Euryarchaeota archaeon]
MIPVPKRFMILLEAVLLVVLIAVVASPLSLPEGSVTGLDGGVGRLDNWDELEGLPPLQRATYLLGDVYCHQMADRSYELNGNQMPFCTRDLGLLAGAALGLGFFALLGRQLPWTWLGLALLPMIADGGLQAITDYESCNVVRALTGALAGSAVGIGAGMLMQRRFSSPEEVPGPRKEDGQENRGSR